MLTSVVLPILAVFIRRFPQFLCLTDLTISLPLLYSFLLDPLFIDAANALNTAMFADVVVFPLIVMICISTYGVSNGAEFNLETSVLLDELGVNEVLPPSTVHLVLLSPPNMSNFLRARQTPESEKSWADTSKESGADNNRPRCLTTHHSSARSPTPVAHRIVLFAEIRQLQLPLPFGIIQADFRPEVSEDSADGQKGRE
ncbi:hypothetical protein BLNAU_22008 [Blattamonas nauphoetae]|uniref:Uncharacterized protein n=1 Tax=Blattamonas nauphoetae TaxID=2049346 RepID=A0ABQ9WU85_9EUKA|nr:hypothetical protein BLNAU_22008 [Blattamonas nauphoetae]